MFWDDPEASDNSGQRPYVWCSMDYGSQFAIGQTEVICQARSRFGIRAACTFTVEVKGKYAVNCNRSNFSSSQWLKESGWQGAHLLSLLLSHSDACKR